MRAVGRLKKAVHERASDLADANATIATICAPGIAGTCQSIGQPVEGVPDGRQVEFADEQFDEMAGAVGISAQLASSVEASELPQKVDTCVTTNPVCAESLDGAGG